MWPQTRSSNRRKAGKDRNMKLLSPGDSIENSAPDRAVFRKCALYRQFLAEREEIEKLKWIESEKAGMDIGLCKAILMWVIHHRTAWYAENGYTHPCRQFDTNTDTVRPAVDAVAA
jgi:hypothetical protein